MDETINKKIYVWEDIEEVEYVSIIDNSGKETICPVTANTNEVISIMSQECGEVNGGAKSKSFNDAINEDYYFRNRRGYNYKLNQVEQTNSFSIYYYTYLCVDMEFKGVGNKDANARGWARSSKEYFKALKQRHPEAFSVTNIALLDAGLSPIIDEAFLKFLPKEYKNMYGKFEGQEL